MSDEFDDIFIQETDEELNERAREIIAKWDIGTRNIIGHFLKKRDARMTTAGAVSMQDRAAKVCKDRVQMWEAQPAEMPLLGIPLKAHLATEADECVVAIMALAAAPVDTSVTIQEP